MARLNRRTLLQWLAVAGVSVLRSPWALADTPKRPRLLLASNTLVADWVREVAGQAWTVEPLIGFDAELHGFEPKPSHGQRLQNASAVFGLGLGADAWLERLARRPARAVPLVMLGEALPEENRLRASPDHHHEHGHKHHHHGPSDPHFWQDPRLVAAVLPTIAATLGTLDTANAAAYRERAQQYGDLLLSQYAAWRARIAEISAERRVALVPHAAFAYFNAAYAVELLGVEDVNPRGELSTRAWQRLRTLVRERGIRVIFRENAVRTSALAERLQRELGLIDGGVLYSDALSQQPGAPSTYLDLVRHNAQTVSMALAENSR